MTVLIFWFIYGHGRGLYALIQFFPKWNFSVGLVGFINFIFQLRYLFTLIVEVYLLDIYLTTHNILNIPISEVLGCIPEFLIYKLGNSIICSVCHSCTVD